MINKTRPAQLIRVGLICLLILIIGSSAPLAGATVVNAAAPIPTAPYTGPELAQMTGSSMNKTIPVEAVPEINLRLGGGTYPGCLDYPQSPVVDYKTDEMDLTGIAIIASCGWKADETVKVTLMDPQGKFFTSEVKAVPSKYLPSVYQVTVYFQPGVDAPVGKYRFTLQGSATLKTHVYFNKITGAKLYAATQDRFQPIHKALGGQHRLRLEGFLPNEPVRLLAYQFEGTLARFYAWQDFKADRTGRLIIETDLTEIGKETEMNFTAYGLETHSVFLERFSADGLRINRQFDLDLYCPGSPAPILSGDEAILPADHLAKLNIHYQPGFGSQVVFQAPANTTMRVYDYPKCIDHAYWWKVSLNDPILFGWVSESRLGKYILTAAK
jgi:hypothetical protein